MERSLTRLLEELIHPDDASGMICRGLLLRVLRMLSTSYEFSLSRELHREMNWLVYEEITDYIREHFRDISITMLMERFHFQEDYFNRLLKAKTGKTYTEYVQELRLNEACRLLTETTETIDSILVQVGYQNKGYFYKIFTARYQMTPARFRREHPGSQTAQRVTDTYYTT